MTSPDFLIEHKHTIRDSISLKKAWLIQVAAGAKRRMKDHALVITFEPASGDKRDRLEDYVLIPMSAFENLRKAAKSRRK